MSVVTLQLGQCGNQIGGQLFTTLLDDAFGKNVHVSASKNSDYIQEVSERFFAGSDREPVLTARAVMVDMEPKVVGQTRLAAKRTEKWAYPADRQFCEKRGSGNSWAAGYCIHGPRAGEAVMEMLQREAEKCDRLSGFLCLLSLAGGTGSGVGTYLTRCLRDEFPHSFIVNQVVWPYRTGEVIVQNYNAVLTLSHLYQTSDALLAMQNDDIQKICSRLLNLKQISFKDLNRVICHKLASILQPVTSNRAAGHGITDHLGDMLEQVTPHPEYKLLSLRNIPQMAEKSLEYSTYQWHGLLKHLRQMLIADAAMEEGINWGVAAGDQTPRGGSKYNRSLSNLLVMRGKDVETADATAFHDYKLCSSWIPQSLGLSVWTQPRAFNSYEKSAALLTNGQSTVGPLNHVISKAWEMFSARAYVHQYVKHGMEEVDFIDSFASLEQVITNYRNL